MTVEAIDLQPDPTELVDVTPLTVELQDVVVGPPGPRGLPGSPGDAGSAWLHVQDPALATWVIPHPFGRIPAVTLYDDEGDQIDADINATATTVTVTYPGPRLGAAVLV